MSERIRHHYERAEKLELDELSKQNLERAADAAEMAEIKGNALEYIREQVDEKAISGREYSVGEREQAPASHTLGLHQQLKRDGYKRTLAHIRSRLSGPEKVFSKHIHGKRAEKIDNVVASTVARPWGILAGGACAFVGSLIILIFATHYGFRYNFGVFLILFFGGYIAGSLLELAGRVIRRRRA